MQAKPCQPHKDVTVWRERNYLPLLFSHDSLDSTTFGNPLLFAQIYSQQNDAKAWDFTTCGLHDGCGWHQDPQDPCDYVEELEDVLSKVHVIAWENLHEAQMRQKRKNDLRIHHYT